MKIKNSQFPQAILKKMYFGIATWRFLHQGGREFFFGFVKIFKNKLISEGYFSKAGGHSKQKNFFLASGVVNLWVDLSCQLSAF